MTAAGRWMTGPTRVAVAWLVAILVGTGVIRLPVSAAGEPLSWLDALFTATSATCVTGLSTIAVGHELSAFGQAVLLILIQLGGLGITTLSTLLLVTAGRATLSQHFATKNALAAIRVQPVRLLAWVLGTTVIIESAGALMLKRCFDDSTGWWCAVFHSVSAFCNAGFSLFANSLEDYREHMGVNVTITLLIMLGGIGFITLHQLASWSWGLAKGRRGRLFLHARTVLAVSAVLWVLGTIMFAALEWDGTMAGQSTASKPLAAWFQSVTTRTAGFNTLDFSAMREPTLFFTMFLMLIGGAPGSCAGGIKVTTVVVILAVLLTRIRGADKVTLLRRTVPLDVVRRSFMLLTLSLVFLTVMVAGLLISEEQRPVGDARSDRFLLLAFETVSAFGTVGLSAGITSGLSAGGKLLIIVCMFVGRLGPLVMALAVIRPGHPPPYEYPQEELAIG